VSPQVGIQSTARRTRLLSLLNDLLLPCQNCAPVACIYHLSATSSPCYAVLTALARVASGLSAGRNLGTVPLISPMTPHPRSAGSHPPLYAPVAPPVSPLCTSAPPPHCAGWSADGAIHVAVAQYRVVVGVCVLNAGQTPRCRLAKQSTRNGCTHRRTSFTPDSWYTCDGQNFNMKGHDEIETFGLSSSQVASHSECALLSLQQRPRAHQLAVAVQPEVGRHPDLHGDHQLLQGGRRA